jgi:hypothetical protein
MLEVLHALVVPVLEQRGFSGRFPDFRRITSRAVDLISFHFARHEAAFGVEVACAPLTGVTIAGQVFVPPNQLTAWHVGPLDRFRLGPERPDQWFRFRRTFPFLSDPHRRAARAVLPYLDSQAETWWRERSSGA